MSAPEGPRDPHPAQDGAAWLQLGALHEAILDFSRATGVEDLWRTVCRGCRWVFPPHRSAVLEETGEGWCRVVARRDRNQTHLGEAQELAGPSPRGLFRLRSASLLDIEAESARSLPVHGWLAADGSRWWLAAPLLTEPEPPLVLVLALAAPPAARRAELASKAALFGLHAGVAYSLLRSSAELRQEIRQRRQAERELERYSQRMAEQVEERTEELLAAQQQLIRQEKLAVLGELAGSVAHEIRNPLAVIRNSAFFLRHHLQSSGAAGDPKTAEHLQLIDGEVATCDRIIRELLEFTRAGSGVPRSTSVLELVDTALEASTLPPEIELRVEPPPRTLTVWADPQQAGRILEHLLTNAVQAMPDGGRLTVRGRDDGDEARIEVADTGVGMDEEQQRRIFEPLVTSKERGIGLGLPLCRRYAELNGGRLECASAPGEGSAFHLFLPTAPPKP